MAQNKTKTPEPEQPRSDDGRFEKQDDAKSSKAAEGSKKAAPKAGGSKDTGGKSSGRGAGDQMSKSR